MEAQNQIKVSITDLAGMGNPPQISNSLFGSPAQTTSEGVALTDLEKSLSLLRATLESTADGLLVVDRLGNIASYNSKFAEMWRLPQEVLSARDDARAISTVLEQLTDPGAFTSKVEQLYSHPEDTSYDRLFFKDGRVFERYSQPQWLGNEILGRVWSFRDITEQVKAEEALRQSEQRYRRLFDEATEGISLIDWETGVILDCNQAFLDLVGWTKSELIGQPQTVLHPSETPHDGASWIPASQGADQKTQSWADEIITRSGAPKLVEVKANTLRINQRRIIQCFFRDLSERRQDERIKNAVYRISEVAQSARNLDELFGLIHGIIGELMPARNFYIALYDAATDLVHFPYFADEFDEAPAPIHPGKSLTGYVLRTGEALLATPQIFDQMVQSGELATIGAPSIDWLGVPLRTQGGETIGVMTLQTYSDAIRLTEEHKAVLIFVSTQVAMVIERKRAESALRRSEEKYRSLFEQSLDMVFMSTPDGRILDVNPAGVALLGYASIDEMLRLESKDLYMETAARDKLLQILQSTGAVRDYELRMKRKDGAILTVLMTCNAIFNSTGDIAILRGILRDVTERTHLAQQLLESQKMESIGRLAGGVAHDFNNLLTAILGFAELILYSSQLPDSIRSAVAEIKKAAERAADLTRQLLAFSRKQVLQPKVFDLNAQILEHTKLLRRVIGENIDLVTALEPHLSRIKADPGQFSQVLMNLVVNARDAMPQGGTLALQTSNILLSEDYTWRHASIKPGPHVMLAVSDSGCGMEAETLSHIFEPFFTTKGVGKGTGLGLSTIYGIIKQSGGHVWAYSEPGKGTTIKIYMPVAEEPAVEEPVPMLCPERLRGNETVFVVEDDEMVRGLVCNTLRLSGYRIVEAANGSEALRLFEHHDGDIHLLVTDVVMPRIGGRELARKLAMMRPDLKVIFMSGYTDDAIVHQGILDPGLVFLQKPFAPNALLHLVRQVLNSPRPAAALK